MYEVIKSVIDAGNFKLADVQHKIKKLWLLGDLTEEQMDQLLASAYRAVNPEAERPAVLEMLQALAAQVKALTARVDEITGGPAAPDVTPGYPAWEPWNGMDDRYQKGAIVNHKDADWISVYEGQNVWEPGTVGDQFWVRYQASEG